MRRGALSRCHGGVKLCHGLSVHGGGGLGGRGRPGACPTWRGIMGSFLIMGWQEISLIYQLDESLQREIIGFVSYFCLLSLRC